jgi:hypothetical protein
MDIPVFDKDKTIFKLMKAEMYYLGNCGWICYCGTVGPEYYDEAGQNTFWAHPDEPKKLMSQRDAMARQRVIDNF